MAETQRKDWPGRPGRFDLLRPHGLRERVALLVAPSLIRRYDHELGAETMRADAGWEAVVELRAIPHRGEQP